MNCFHQIWPYLKDVFDASCVLIEIAVLGVIIAWRQLSYAKNRDKALDIRKSWGKIHETMVEFRFRREMLNNPPPWANEPDAVALAATLAALALNNIRGQLDRTPDSPLVTEITDFLEDNLTAAKWRANDFIGPFDKFAHEAALKAR